MLAGEHIAMLHRRPKQMNFPDAETGAYGAVVFGGSAGGIPALIGILSLLPADFPLPILIVQHLSPTLPSKLPQILGWRSKMAVRWAEDGECLRCGVAYVAPPNRHLLVTAADRVRLSDAPVSGWWRPAVDVLFRSAAEVYGERAIGVILSGAMWDGAEGIAAIARVGGITIAQDEKTSHQFDMPAAAIDFGGADVTMSTAEIAEAVGILAAL